MKKLLSTLLSVLMIVTCASFNTGASVYADSTTHSFDHENATDLKTALESSERDSDKKYLLKSGNYYLNSNLTLDGGIIIESGETVNICLNGYVIDVNDNSFWNTGTLSIYDCSTANNTHYFTVESFADVVNFWKWDDDEEEGAINFDSLSSAPSVGDVIAVNGGCITNSVKGEHATINGGDATNISGALNINNVNFVGIFTNKPTSGSMVFGLGNTLNIIDCLFAGNFGIAGIIECEMGVSNIKNVCMKYNSGMYSGGITSGLYGMDSNLTINITNCEITDNKAISGGLAGGILNYSGTMNIGGNTVCTNNDGPVANNLLTLVPITIANGDNAPKEGMNVDIALYDSSTYELTTGKFTTNGSASDAQYFHSDKNEYLVAYNAGGYLELVNNEDSRKVTIDSGITNGSADVYLKDSNTAVVTTIADDGYELDKITVTSNGTTINLNDDNSFTLSGPVTVSATFKVASSSTPSLINNESSDFTVKSGEGYKEFTKGSATTSTIHIGDLDLSKVYKDASDKYTGVLVVNGTKTLTEGTDYTVSEGSVKVNLTDTYLNSLGVGTHTINVYVNKSGAASSTSKDYEFEVTVKVNAAASSGGSGESGSSGDSGSTYKAPNTGVEGVNTNNSISKIVGLISLVTLAGYAVIKKKED